MFKVLYNEPSVSLRARRDSKPFWRLAKMFISIVKQPSAFIPVVMSLAALAIVLRGCADRRVGNVSKGNVDPI